MILIIQILAATIYAIRTIIFLIGLKLIKAKKVKIIEDEYALPYVSVIIPARNEQDNIRKCILSISKSNYPGTKFEIIAVNDRSSDSTCEILKELSSQLENLKIVNIYDYTSNQNLQGKPGALHEGIKNAKGEILLMTDADCVVGKDWIKTVTSAFQNEKIAIVPSLTSVSGNRFFDKLQAIEWALTHTLAAAGIGLNIPLGCFGNNLSIRKSDYWNIGGYEKVRFSVTEDFALLNAVVRTGKKANYLINNDTVVVTQPCRTLNEFISQQHRWIIGGIDLGWKAFYFVLTTAAIWMGCILSLLSGSLYWFIAFLLIRFLSDIILLATTLITIKRQDLFPWLIPSIFTLFIWELVLPLLALKKDVKWKGQIFKKNININE